MADSWAGGPVFALGQGKAHRLGHAQALAVLGQALHIQDLLKGDGRLLALQGGAVPAFPGAEGLDLPFDHRLARQQLDLGDGGAAADVQHGGGRLGKGHRPVGGKQLIQHGGPPHPPQHGQPLLDAAAGQGGDGLGGGLGGHRRRQAVGPPHLDPPRGDGPAVDVLGLPFHQGAPCGKGEVRQLQHLVKRQLLLGLAQARALLPLIVDGAADVALQGQAAGLQLFLQHHRPCKALDHLEHLGQIIRDQDLGLDGYLRLDGAAPAAPAEDIAEYLQFHVYGAPFRSLIVA